MYSRSETNRIKQTFWTAFGKYLALETNSEGEKINWINYHTGFKDVYFRMDADQTKAYIGIELTHPDSILRQLYYEKFTELKPIFTNKMEEPWNWKLNTHDEYGKSISSISTQLTGVNIFNQSDWPAIISFLKPRMMALDRFWNEVKDGFEELR